MKDGPLNVRRKWVPSLRMSDANVHVSQWKIAISILAENMKQKLTEQWQNEATTWAVLERHKAYVSQ